MHGKWMTIEDAARESGVTIEVIRRAVALSLIPVHMPWNDTRFRLIHPDDLEEFKQTMGPVRQKKKHGEGNFRTRFDGRFEYRMSLPDGGRKSIYGKTEKELWARVENFLERQEEPGATALRSGDI